MLPPGIGQTFRLSSPSTVLYNPKAFVAHAASLGQACAHCRRSSTAATRRCLASVSVPVARVVLSHPLRIFALVGRHPANKLIRCEPLPRRNSFPGQEMPLNRIAGNLRVLPLCSHPRGTLPTHYCPFRHYPQLCIATQLVLVRLACLIHAANVRSEPGSNPSKRISFQAPTIRFQPRITDVNELTCRQIAGPPIRTWLIVDCRR